MRSPLLLLALCVVTGCGGSDDNSATAASAASLGSDAIILRVPAEGGTMRAYRYPAIDSLIWQSRAALPAQMRALGFSMDDGSLAFADTAGFAWRLLLGSGALERAHAAPLTGATSADGTAIFGASAGAVLRLTPSEATPWQAAPRAELVQFQPTRDGGVLVIGHRGTQTVLTRFRPPASTPTDSAVFEGTARLISAAGGDRIYLSDGPRGLVSVRSRDLERLGAISLGDSIIATASSPSGDRVYVLGRDDDDSRVQVINKYTDEIAARIDVPADASALRMDPLGRYLLVRFAGARDSVLVIGIASDKVVGRVASPWRTDLPMVLPDGHLAVLRDDDVVTLAPGNLRPVAVVPRGARDLWTVVQWNGFRRRAGDAPVRATATLADTSRKRTPDSARVASDSGRTAKLPADSAARRPVTDSSRKAAARADSARRSARADSQAARERNARPVPEASQNLGERGAFVVQFAALKAEGPARQLASAIKANGEQARVVSTTTNGIVLYRVILGPYRSRADAERAGQAAKRDYWVFEGGSN